MNQPSLTRYAWLSIGAAVITIGLKLAAYLFTGSVGLLSDAIESLVNLIGAVVALTMLTIAAQPPDEEHAYGHSKAEYFSSGVEGTLIVIAAISIVLAAGQRLVSPQPIEDVGLGLTISLVASLINLVVARILLRTGRQHSSIALEADGRHLMTDVWTSVGVVLGVAAVAITGWLRLDAIIALFVAANIIREGWRLLKRTVAGLMDAALPVDEQNVVRSVLEKYEQEGIQFHAMRTRQAGARRFVSIHVLVPDTWTVQRGHQLLERLETDVRQALPNVTVFTHLEPLGDAASWQDTTLDRPDSIVNETGKNPDTEAPKP
jgi:cation diffusion facilitator family transporter